MHSAKVVAYMSRKPKKTMYFQRTFRDFSQKHGIIAAFRLTKAHSFVQFFKLDMGVLRTNLKLTYKYSRTQLFRILKGGRNWFDIGKVRDILCQVRLHELYISQTQNFNSSAKRSEHLVHLFLVIICGRFL